MGSGAGSQSSTNRSPYPGPSPDRLAPDFTHAVLITLSVLPPVPAKVPVREAGRSSKRCVVVSAKPSTTFEIALLDVTSMAVQEADASTVTTADPPCPAAAAAGAVATSSIATPAAATAGPWWAVRTCITWLLGGLCVRIVTTGWSSGN